MAKVKYYVCDNIIYSDKEIDTDKHAVDFVIEVDTDFTTYINEREIKKGIINYLYGDSVQPIWLIDNRFKNCIWKSRR